MHKHIFLFLVVFTVKVACGQNEQVYLHFDKYSCRVGDTLWFKGYILKGAAPSRVSTNLYVDMFTQEGIKIGENMFPIEQGVSIGQLKVPDSIKTGNYFVRGFTRYQLNFDSTNLFTVPVLVYNKDYPRPVFHKKQVPPLNLATGGSIKGIFWTTTTYKGQLSSMLEIDSGSSARTLHLVQPILKDSGMLADIVLDNKHQEKYTLFPMDTTKEAQLLLLFEDSILLGRQVLYLQPRRPVVTITADTLDANPEGYNSWQIKFPDTSLYTASVSITDAANASNSPASILRMKSSHTEDLTKPILQLDTSYITFQGKATKESGKKIKDPFSRDILLAGARDTTFLFTRVVRMDSVGNFLVAGLSFYDTISLQFQINKQEDGSTKNIRLQLSKFIPPGGDSSVFVANWEDDSIPLNKADTFYSKSDLTKYELSKMKTLKTVVVKGWKNPRKELDNKYTTGAFSEPAMYSFDIRTETRYRDLGSYLRMNFSRFQGGFGPSDTPYDVMGHPFLFYVDEQLYSWPELQMFDWEKIAYIKCFENDFIGDDPFTKWKTGVGGFTLAKDSGGGLGIPVQKTPMIISIYTRKGTDYRTMAGGLNKINVKGFSSIIKFQSDHSTIFWEPLLFGNSCRIRFNNHESARRFRIVVEGFDYKGDLVHAEEIIEPK